ncbi:hypothetical protein [Mycetocola lacteus]|uniref:hypothetical protein n=1 Tax=Mycetocola lacteus TaxID=76637 RepID=UPI0015FED01D|nr:hypothetical protein [Mycetocola lacteus]
MNTSISLEKIQQIGGHLPDADALGRARRILMGELTEAEACAELNAKFLQQ